MSLGELKVRDPILAVFAVRRDEDAITDILGMSH